MKKGIRLTGAMLAIFLLVVVFVANFTVFSMDKKEELVLATTTSTMDSGLLDILIPAFEQEAKMKVKVLSLGTGQAIKIGELGDCDVILVHARETEDKFVADEFGVNRRDVMYNDYVLVGPANDPAGIKKLPILEAMKKLSQGKVDFISRGDDSGTNIKEISLWKEAKVKSTGSWYKSVGKGMGDTLIMTNELGAYTLTDRGTYASMKDRIALKVMVEGDPGLLNPYGVIAVNPEKHRGINYDGAMAFVKFITSAHTKKMINDYKVNGEQLFHAE